MSYVCSIFVLFPVMLVDMFVIDHDNIIHFWLSFCFWQIKRLLVFRFFYFLLFEKLDQRNCIKFCLKNEINCTRTFEIWIRIWRVHQEQNTSSIVVLPVWEKLRRCQWWCSSCSPAFQKCFEDWKKRWHKYIISDGGYFEADKIVVDK